VYGVAAKLPSRYTNAVLMGINLSGVIAAIFMIMSIAVSPTPQVLATYLFSFAVVFQMICFANEFIIRRNVSQN